MQLQYVGTDTYDSNQMMSDISKALSNLKLEFQLRGKTINLTLDDLFRRYIQYLPLLPTDAMTWSFSLVTLFFNAFPTDLRDAILKEGYNLPNLSFLITESLQAAALQDLREKAVIFHKTLADEATRIKKLLSSHLHPRSHSHVPNALSHYSSNSQTETTITRHSELPTSIDTPRPMVVKQDGKSYPQNPSNSYVSKYPDGFFGCLG